jgi:SSS family solute:Na+ symporter
VVAFTGILATMPYIALQLVGIQAVLDVMGVGGGENTNWFVKDTLIYVVIVVAIIYIPIKLGGFDEIFAAADKKYTDAGVGGLLPAPTGQWTYATLALGSAMAMSMYPHSITATLSSRSREVIRRSTTVMPLYTLMLGLLALLGFMAMAIAASCPSRRPISSPATSTRTSSSRTRRPHRRRRSPSWSPCW